MNQYFLERGESSGFNRYTSRKRLLTGRSATALWFYDNSLSHFYSMGLQRKLTYSERAALIKTLNSLTDPEFKQIVFVLDPPPGVIPADTAALGDRVPVLLHWVEKSPTGPGLAKLQEVLARVRGQSVGSPGSPPGASFPEDLGSGIELEMIHIPGGVFRMGSPEDEEGRYKDEGPQHRVIVPAFFMGKYPVTQLQWHSVSLLAKVESDLAPDPSCFKRDNLPVERVSWDDAVEFCARLSKYSGKDYRLPSEAEWEYACRAGTMTPYHFGETITPDLANFGRHYNETTEVGKFRANAFGLYDKHGNVWEWCLDHSHPNYEGAPTDGSAWVTGGNGLYRIIRGGSWGNDPRDCRSAHRDWTYPKHSGDYFSFRVCCSPPRTP